MKTVTVTLIKTDGKFYKRKFFIRNIVTLDIEDNGYGALRLINNDVVILNPENVTLVSEAMENAND